MPSNFEFDQFISLKTFVIMLLQVTVALEMPKLDFTKDLNHEVTVVIFWLIIIL